MIGQNQITLNHQAVIEALQEYVEKRFAKGKEQIVRDFGVVDSTGAVPGLYPNPVIGVGIGICIYIEHAKSFVTGTP